MYLSEVVFPHNLPKINEFVLFMVPTGTGNQGKPGKIGRHFPVREKSGNFVKTGKVRENQGILLKILEKLEKIILEN